MIIVMPKKVFEKKIRKLAIFKDYIVVDATSDMKADISTHYSSSISVDDFAVPSKVMKYYKNAGDWTVDEDKIKKIQKGWIKGKTMAKSICSVVDTFLRSENQINIFIVMKNKDYELMGEKLVYRFNELLGTDIKFIYTWEEGGCKSVLEKDLPEKYIKELEDCSESLKDALVKEIKKKKHKTLRNRSLDDDDAGEDYYGKRKKNKSKIYKKYFKDIIMDDDDGGLFD